MEREQRAGVRRRRQRERERGDFPVSLEAFGEFTIASSHASGLQPEV